MVRARKKQKIKSNRRKTSKKKSISSFIKKEERIVYKKYLHPLAEHFEFWLADWHSRIIVSAFIGYILTLVSQIYPICTQDMCFRSFLSLAFRPDLIFKPFISSILAPQFIVYFTLFTWFWFVLLSFLGRVHLQRKLPDVVVPFLVILIFIYMLMMTSGTLAPFIIGAGNLDCVTNADCIRAGYVGEVCTSIYKPAYTVYSRNLEALTTCTCIQNQCIGG